MWSNSEKLLNTLPHFNRALCIDKETIRLEIKDKKLPPSEWLDDLNDEQRTRIELLYEEMIESGFNPKRIRCTIEHARYKEIMFAVRNPEG